MELNLNEISLFKYCYDYLNKLNKNLTIVELGTVEVLLVVDLKDVIDDVKYWEPDNPEKWDWSAGSFTKFF